MNYKLENPIVGTMELVRYQCSITWRNGQFIADEPVASGGKDEGPDPFSQLIASLVSCTLITLRMYIDRKGWDVPHIEVKGNLFQYVKEEKTTTVFDRDIRFPDNVSEEQKERLIEIAKACPVSRILEGDNNVRTFVYNDAPSEKHITYKGKDISVVWKPSLCKHSGRCVSQLPKVFDLNGHPWVNMEGADEARIIAQVGKCPTGALSIKAL